MTISNMDADVRAETLPANGTSETPINPDHEEHQYLNLIRRILREGERRPDRTGTGTLSIFAPPQLRFSLSKPARSSAHDDSCASSPDPHPHPNLNPNPDADTDPWIPILPLLTTKRVFLRAVTAELLWFISGGTSSLPLAEAGIHIWDGNGSREYLDRLGFTDREEGDLGPVYGFQWRHFGAEYRDCHADYEGQGVDQIREIVRKLKNEPFDRRIILSAWNVADLAKMALPPCHMFAQFYVSYPEGEGEGEGDTVGTTETDNDNDTTKPNPTQTKTQPNPGKGHLSCLLYQRSCDLGLGVPFNIASYALLTHMLAHACDLVPDTLIHNMGDAHVYLDHVDVLRQQLTRSPLTDFPRLNVKRDDRGSGVMDGWKAEDFEVVGYKPQAGLKMKLSV